MKKIQIYIKCNFHSKSNHTFLEWIFIYSYFTNASLNPAFFAFANCLSAFLLSLYAPICTRYSFFPPVDGLDVDVPFANSFFTSSRNVSIDLPCFENQ